MKIKFLIFTLTAGIFLTLPAWLPEAKAAIPTETSEQYNGTTNQLEQFRDDTWKRMGVPAEHQKSIGTCSVEGQQTFNTATNRMEFCDGGKRFSLICAKSLNGCMGSMGRQEYDTTLGVLRYCDGTRWIYMGSIPGVPCCPEGFVPVPKNPAAGTNKDFCISKYHMKPAYKISGAPHRDSDPPRNNPNLGDIGNYTPESRPEDMPWGNLTLSEAKEACNKLNKTGIPGEFHLITNAEWMTVAYSIENNPQNWSEGAVGTGHLPTGHSDGFLISGQNFLDADPTDSNPCWGTGNPNCTDKHHDDFWQKRTFILNNLLTPNVIIWDMAGNSNSWVDAGGIISHPVATPAPGSIYQLNDPVVNEPSKPGPTTIYPLLTPSLFPLDPKSETNKIAFLPSRMDAYVSPNDYYDQLGLGIIRLEEHTNVGLFRGGKFDEPRAIHPDPDPDSANRHFKQHERERRGGLYSVWLFDANSHFSDLGFRCTYIPEN